MVEIFCTNHTETEENSLGTDCMHKIYISSLMGIYPGNYKCPFTTDHLTYENPFPEMSYPDQLIVRSFERSKNADGICRDFKALDGLEESLTEIAKENMKKK